MHYLQFDSSGNVVASGTSLDGTLPANGISCTDAQYATANQWRLVNGQIVAQNAAVLLTQAQTSQTRIIRAASVQAEHAPLAFTNAAGVSSTYPMDAHSWTKYLAAYTRYVVHGLPFPNGTTYPFYDVNGKGVPMTLTDIANIFEAGMTQIEGVLAKQASLFAEIESASTISAVQSVAW